MKKELLIKLNNINKNEKKFFFVFTIINLIPAIYSKYFPSMDGAAHLYNVNIIQGLLSENNSFLEAFYELNPLIVPNWIGHVILLVAELLLPVYLAEKLILILCLIGLPYAFKYLVKSVPDYSTWVVYLIFPFTYHFLFLLGFYNYSIALIGMLFCIGFWIRHYQSMALKRYLLIGLTINLLFFCHLFIYNFTLGAMILYTAIPILLNRNLRTRTYLIFVFKRVGSVMALALPTIILNTIYFIKHPLSGSSSYESTSTLTQWLFEISSSKGYGSIHEKIILPIVFSIILLLFIIGLSLLSKKNTNNTFTLYTLIVAVLLLIGYFYFPNSNGGAGFISSRFQLLLFLFILLFLSTIKYNNYISRISFFVIIVASLFLNQSYSKHVKQQSDIAKACVLAADYILENSIVLPINISNNWLSLHYSNYLGIDKDLVILDNYEAGTSYFPVNWKQNLTYQLSDSLMSSNDCNYKLICNSENCHPIDYVFILKRGNSEPNQCLQDIQNVLNTEFEMVHESFDVLLYKRKQGNLIEDQND